MAEAKTRPTNVPVADFIDQISDPSTRKDCWTIIGMMQSATQSPPQLWGTSIIGFGMQTIQAANGKTSEWPQIGFSPRKQALTLYLKLGGVEKHQILLERLGKHTTGKGCLYIKKLSDVDEGVLKELIGLSI
jgi:hypothetical protein